MGLLNSYKKSEVVIKKEVKALSLFDYSEFSKKERENLIELEERAIHTGTKLSENLQELGSVFNAAHEIFSNNKNGSFGKWYESIGFKKDFVYLCLDRQNLAIKYAKKEIYNLPDRTVKDLKKYDTSDETELVYEILEAEKPTEKLKEIKELKKLDKINLEQKSEKKFSKKELTERENKSDILERLYSLTKITSKTIVTPKKAQIIKLLEELKQVLDN